MEERKSHLTEGEVAGLHDLIEVSRTGRDVMLKLRREVMGRLFPGIYPSDEELEREAERSLVELEAVAASGDMSLYLAQQRESAAQLADQGLGFDTIGRALVDLVNPLADLVESTFASEPRRATRALRALHMLETEFLLTAGASYASVREDTVESGFQSMIRRLSTPVIQVWDEVLVMPLIGVVDTARAQQMMENLLERIVEEQARFVILDITGVPTVDTAVAEHLIKTTRAGHLVGARTVLVGISPQVAQTLVRLGVSLDDISTFTDLRSGLEHVFEALGYRIQRGRG